MPSRRFGAQALSRTGRTAQAEHRTDELGILRGVGIQRIVVGRSIGRNSNRNAVDSLTFFIILRTLYEELTRLSLRFSPESLGQGSLLVGLVK